MSPVTDPILSIQHVGKRFSGVVALQDITLEIQPGELHAIVGENGAGKSTLMKILAGVIPDYEGQILLQGHETHFRDTRAAEAAGIRIIHQELNLVEQLSAAANIFLGRELCAAAGWLDDHAMERRTGELLSQLECRVSPRQLVGELRVGDQQLVEIAKAIAFKADIIIMDEPTSALTEGEVARLFRIIAGLKEQGVTILYISHKMDEVFHLADRITVLRDGRFVKTLDKTACTPREITHLMVGRDIEQAAHREPHPQGRETLLEVRNLHLPWPGHARRWRLENINFNLHKGEVLGIAGLMGAGRTELLECLFGCSPVRPTGTILLGGQTVRFSHPAEACAQGVALVTEDRKRLGLFADMDVEENMTLSALRNFAATGWVSASREHHAAQATVQKLGVKTAGLRAPITSLSGGNQQKVIIGRWMLTNPRLLLLDDPTRGIDVGAKAEIYRLIDELCRSGIGVIVTSSELPELMTISDRIMVLCEGKQTGEFPRQDFTEQALMEAATHRT